MFPFYEKDKRTDHEIYLENEIDRYREEENRRLDQEREERERRERQHREDVEYDMRTAGSWPDALRKQQILFDREVRREAEEDRKFGLAISDGDEDYNRWLWW